MVNVGVLLPDWFGDAGDYLADARALEEAAVHSLWLKARAGRPRLDPNMMLAGIAAVTSRVKLGLMLSTSDPTATPDVSLQTLQRLSRGRAITGRTVRGGKELVAGPQPVERFVLAPVPANPADWTKTLESAAAHDAGVLVPMFPALLDLLRRPDQVEDRSDLFLSQG
jgi:Luciferase-like monooxygenase